MTMTNVITRMRTTPYTTQEAYNIIVKHLASMKERAGFVNEDGTFICRYLHEDKKCAIGILIPDEYCEALANKTIYIIMTSGSKEYSEVQHLFSVISSRFLDMTQRIHDYTNNWLNGKADMYIKLKYLGMDYELNLEVLDEAWKGYSER